MLKDVNVNSFFPRTGRIWNSAPLEWFPLTYDLSGFQSRINRHFNCRFFLNRFLVCCNIFVLLFLVTSCLVVAVQPCMEWIPMFFLMFYCQSSISEACSSKWLLNLSCLQHKIIFQIFCINHYWTKWAHCESKVLGLLHIHILQFLWKLMFVDVFFLKSLSCPQHDVLSATLILKTLCIQVVN